MCSNIRDFFKKVDVPYSDAIAILNNLIVDLISIFTLVNTPLTYHNILRNSQPDIAAPGVAILAASPNTPEFKGVPYHFQSGTSMACPHVSGIIAVLKSLHPEWSPAALKSAIMTTGNGLICFQKNMFDLEFLR